MNQVKDNKLDTKIHKLLEDSFKGMVEKGHLGIAKENFNNIDDQLRESLVESNTLIINAENIEEEKTEKTTERTGTSKREEGSRTSEFYGREKLQGGNKSSFQKQR